MHRLNVALGERSYPIFIGSGLLAQKDILSAYLGDEGVLIVTNETVAPLYLDLMVATLGDRKVDRLILPDGEQYKHLNTLDLIFDALLENRHNRGTTLIALGGGVIGDMTGFAAACYQRGVDFIQVPTTLLAQVDSSVGGKTAVNHRLGKNMIGAFHQPRAVLIDIDTLKTLPEREFKAGLAEVVKYGLIIDSAFFDWLEQNVKSLLARDEEALLYAIESSCRLKAEVVSADERESGIRAILNLGHTFGHAVETFQSYSSWLHGEAIAAGMVMAAELSSVIGWLSESDVSRVRRILAQIGLPIAPPENISAQKFLDLMAVDKKARRGTIGLVLLEAIGHATVSFDYDPSILEEIVTSR
ncbi:MAG: 3-dehydroquinate synthase [Gammaproteobacteria bacterium]|nr:MAG: 3-dehydroquinate synthase [Gammaproteobacteria bacterium]RLA54865.1 MAG: 3-dehydroquinate synthase [Gammaproteobacteria bacterium]